MKDEAEGVVWAMGNRGPVGEGCPVSGSAQRGECIAFCVIGSGRQWESSHERRPQSVGKASAKVM